MQYKNYFISKYNQKYCWTQSKQENAVTAECILSAWRLLIFVTPIKKMQKLKGKETIQKGIYLEKMKAFIL